MGESITSLFGSSPASPPSLQVYQPQYTSQADTGAFQGIQAIQGNNPYLQNQPTYQNVMQAGLTNPYAPAVQTAANAAGTQYANLGVQGAAASTALNNGAMSLLPYVSQVENTAMDPQNALYNRTKQQVMDQANVSNAQNGLTGSPYGAGVTNAANSNFNIDWQNNKLARQTQGLTAATSGLQGASNVAGAAQTIGDTAAADTGLSGAAPNAAFLSNLANLLNSLNSYGTSQTNANANTQTAVGDFLGYLQQGENQSNQQANFNQQSYEDQQQYANDSNAQLFGSINSALDFGSGLFSGLTGSSGAGAGSFTGSAASSDAEWAAFLAA